MSEIYLAGGCFWGLEKHLASIHRVKSTQVGYANGNTESPTYEEVCYQNIYNFGSIIESFAFIT